MQLSQIDLMDAQRLIDHAIATAQHQGVNIGAIVTDLGGHPLAFARMSQAGAFVFEVCRRKAVTAGNFKTPTNLLGTFLAQDALRAANAMQMPDMMLLPGGFPIMQNGQCIGALGIAGGRENEDQMIGEKALMQMNFLYNLSSGLVYKTAARD